MVYGPLHFVFSDLPSPNLFLTFVYENYFLIDL